MFSLADSNSYYLSFFMNTDPVMPGLLGKKIVSCTSTPNEYCMYEVHSAVAVSIYYESN